MTKIKLDIESDETIVSAKILLRHANGKTEIQDVDTIESKQSSMSMMDKFKQNSSIATSGIDDAFKETY